MMASSPKAQSYGAISAITSQTNDYFSEQFSHFTTSYEIIIESDYLSSAKKRFDRRDMETCFVKTLKNHEFQKLLSKNQTTEKMEDLLEKIHQMSLKIYSGIEHDIESLNNHLQNRWKTLPKEISEQQGIDDDTYTLYPDELETLNAKKVHWNNKSVTQATQLRGEWTLLNKRIDQAKKIPKIIGSFALPKSNTYNFFHDYKLLRSKLRSIKESEIFPQSDFSRRFLSPIKKAFASCFSGFSCSRPGYYRSIFSTTERRTKFCH